jgi:hypothetical protein
MQPWTVLDAARLTAFQYFRTDFIYDQPQTFLDHLAEAHTTMQDQFAAPPAQRDYWTARNACLDIIVRAAMIYQDGDPGPDPNPPYNPPFPVALFLHAVGETATVMETEYPEYNHWDDFDASLSAWTSNLSNEFAKPPDERDRLQIYATLENMAAAACLFISRARFTIHDRDPHARENFAVHHWTGNLWETTANHCHAGFTPDPPDFPGNQKDETLCRPCREYSYSYRSAAPRAAIVPPTIGAIPYFPLKDLGTEFGIVTGCNATHYPCVAATCLNANQHRIAIAIADHGLTPEQRRILARFGVRWIPHYRPTIPAAMPPSHAVAEPRAYWKPWICYASPFEHSLWVDADAIVSSDIRPKFHRTNPPPLFTRNDTYSIKSWRLYVDYHQAAQLPGPAPTRDNPATIVNTGVLLWTAGDELITDWIHATQALIDAPHLHALANTRDQSTMYAVLARRLAAGQPDPIYLDRRWNCPADYHMAPDAHRRNPLPVNPDRLLAVTRRRHPDAFIVHWLGVPKPETLYQE